MAILLADNKAGVAIFRLFGVRGNPKQVAENSDGGVLNWCEGDGFDADYWLLADVSLLSIR